MLAVFKREFKSYFHSPLGYILMGFFLLISGMYFAMLNLLSGSAHYIEVLAKITFVFLIVVPLLTMRLMTEDIRLKTDQLLLTSPLSITGLVLGKYVAAVGVFGVTILITCLYPVILNGYAVLAVGEIIGGYIGFFLLGAAFIAIGLFISSMTENQIVAAIATFGALLVVSMLGWIQEVLPKDALSGAIFAGILAVLACYLVYRATKNLLVSIIPAVLTLGGIATVYALKKTVFDGFITYFCQWFSLISRYRNFTMGVFDLSAIIYYLSIAALFIFLTVRVIEKRRWS